MAKKTIIKENKKKPSNTLIIIALVLVIPILILGYLGFVPGVSYLMGANRPKDLGVRVTEQDFITASEKLGRTRETLPSSSDPADSLKFQGSHAVDATFTQEEMTATMQTRDYRYNPIGNDFQARFNDDGTVEMSGRIIMRNLRPYGKAAGVSNEQADEIMSKIDAIKVNPAFYIKGTASVTNNRPNIDIQEVKIGRVGLPADALPLGYIERFAEDRVENIPGLYVKDLHIDDGKLVFKGTYPDKSYYDTG